VTLAQKFFDHRVHLNAINAASESRCVPQIVVSFVYKTMDVKLQNSLKETQTMFTDL